MLLNRYCSDDQMKRVTMGRELAIVHIWGRRETHSEIWWEKPGGREHLEEQGINREYYKMNLKDIWY